VRHRHVATRNRAVDSLVQLAEDVATRRGLRGQWDVLMDQRAVPMHPFLVSQVEQAVSKAGCEPCRMVSGAGHDAMILAERVPAAMIFRRTPGGISGDAAESVEV